MEDIATDVLYDKCKHDGRLARLLLSTGNAEIVNVSINQVWGIGPDSHGKNSSNSAANLEGSWPGTNIQGKARMCVWGFLNALENSKYTSRSSHCNFLCSPFWASLGICWPCMSIMHFCTSAMKRSAGSDLGAAAKKLHGGAGGGCPAEQPPTSDFWPWI